MNRSGGARSHWKRNLLLVVLALVAVAGVSHAIWSARVSRQLRDRIASLQQAGEPILPQDFNAKLPDGPDNAATYLRQAAALMKRETEAAEQFDRLDLLLPLTADERTMLQKLLAESAEALALVDTASQKNRCDWLFDLRTPAIERSVGNEFNGLRDLANRLTATAILAHDGGDDAAARRSIDQLISLSRQIDQYPTMLGHLVAAGVGAMACVRLDEIACDLKFPDGQGARYCEPIIARLLDDTLPREGFRRAMRSERMVGLDTIGDMRDNVPIKLAASDAPTSFSPRARYLMRPVLESNALRMMEYTTQMIHVADADTLPAARAVMPSRDAIVGEQSMMGLIATLLTMSLDRSVDVEYRYTTERRLAATALAIAWYRSGHGGELPTTLDQLVPRYLPEIPRDPMSANGTPLGYKPAATQPILYSVGENGTDDGGDSSPSRPKAQSAVGWAQRDYIIFLKRQPRPQKEAAE